MGQALYRKYRSKSLAEIVGQEHITDTLEKAIKSGRISHAYLFTGPRGVGKTSIARILAHEINGLPYDEGQTHLDIIEIDAASNNGVEDVRDLREKVYVAPSSAKYKVYIIDEVHMLSKAAFNALLKTLEEPPAHAVFILATTESHKLPATIISRTQRFVFRPIDHAKAVEHLKSIAKAEKMHVTDEALELIAAHGDGSFRDSISLLDQVASHADKVDVADVQAMLGMPPAQVIDDLAHELSGKGQASDIINELNTLYDAGYQAAAIAVQLGALLRQQIITNQTTAPLHTIRTLLTGLLEVASSRDPERYLEIILLGSIPAFATPQTVSSKVPEQNIQATPTPPPPAAVPETPPHAIEPAKKATEPEPIPEDTKPEKTTSKSAKASHHTNQAAALDEETWQQVLGSLKQQYNTLYSVVRMAKPTFNKDGKLELCFAFAFHQKRLSEAKNRQIVSDAIEQVTGQPVDIICTLDPDLKLATPSSTADLPDVPGVPPDPKPQSEALSAISNIFGGGELLES